MDLATPAFARAAAVAFLDAVEAGDFAAIIRATQRMDSAARDHLPASDLPTSDEDLCQWCLDFADGHGA